MQTEFKSSPLPQASAVTAATQQAFRSAMAQLGAAVHVVTTDGPGGRAGFSASAVCSVTDSPPTVLVCLNRGSSAYQATVANGIVCINTLSAEQQPMSAAFAGKTPMHERFEHGAWKNRQGYAPVLEGSAMSIDCRITSRVPVGTHDILVCEVLSIEDNEAGSCLIYFNRQYHRL